jgi:hypothetical protein
MAEVVGPYGQLEAVGSTRRGRRQVCAQGDACVADEDVQRQSERGEVGCKAADAGEAGQVALHRDELAWGGGAGVCDQRAQIGLDGVLRCAALLDSSAIRRLRSGGAYIGESSV